MKSSGAEMCDLRCDSKSVAVNSYSMKTEKARIRFNILGKALQLMIKHVDIVLGFCLQLVFCRVYLRYGNVCVLLWKTRLRINVLIPNYLHLLLTLMEAGMISVITMAIRYPELWDFD